MKRVQSIALPVRLALREMRGGLRGFYVFVACIALGVMAIAGVGSVSSGLVEGIAREGRIILGGDLSFTLIQREATSDELNFMQHYGKVSTIATLRAMARTTDGRSTLVEVKVLDDAYPLFGAVQTEPQHPLAALLGDRDRNFGAIADPILFARLDLSPGAQVAIGNIHVTIGAALTSEPDKLASGIGFGPRLMISGAALRASELLQPGSIVRWHYRLRLPLEQASDRDIVTLIDEASRRFPEAGWDIRTRSNASPQLERNVERFTQYLTLVGLAALLIGGVGIANSTKHYLDRKRDTIAVMKSLGATGSRVFVIYVCQILLLAAIGATIGLAIGAIFPFALASLLVPLLPIPFVPALHPLELLSALAYGVATAVAFAVWPLGRAHDVPVSALFRDEVAPERRVPRARYIVATAVAIAVLGLLTVAAAHDRRIAIIFVFVASGVFVTLRLIAGMLMAIARGLPRPRSTMLRLAIGNIHRPGALTVSVVLSLGLGLALLVTVLEIDGNLRRQFLAALPARAPSFYFLDIDAHDADRFAAFVHNRAPRASVEQVPMLRGRIVSANGVKAEDIKPRQDAAWVLQSDRGITYTTQLPQGSRVVEGEWWTADYAGPPLLSFEKKLADGLGLHLGDEVTVNVLGRNISARIANMRTVDWQSLGINFVLVFSPGAFAGAPVTHIATLTYPGGGTVDEETALLKAVSDAFPAVTAVRVKDVLDAVGDVVINLVLAIRGASAVTLLTAIMVLGGALAAGHRHRVYDAVVLKTLGATRRQLLAAYGLEYLILGLATVVFGIAAGSLAAWGIVAELMNFRFVWQAAPAASAAVVALAITLVFGSLGTFAALGRKPAPVLRNLRESRDIAARLRQTVASFFRLHKGLRRYAP